MRDSDTASERRVTKSRDVDIAIERREPSKRHNKIAYAKSSISAMVF